MNPSNSFKLIFLGISFIATSAFAGPTKVTARDYRCADLQKLLSEQNELIVRAYIFGRYHVVANPNQCPSFKIAKAASFSTLDSNSCELGFTCEFPPNEPGGP